MVPSLARSIFSSVFGSKQDKQAIETQVMAGMRRLQCTLLLLFQTSGVLAGCWFLEVKKKPNSCNTQGQAAVLGDFEIGTKMT